MRKKQSFLIPDNKGKFLKQMLNWAERFNICVFMDSHNYSDQYGQYDFILACKPFHIFNSIQSLQKFLDHQNDWVFGHINFEAGFRYFNLSAKQSSKPVFPELMFFNPEIVMLGLKNEIIIESLSLNPHEVFSDILNSSDNINPQAYTVPVQFSETEYEYLGKIKEILRQIQSGNCYEMNYCTHFFAENVQLQPLQIYHQLSKISPNPFSCYYKLDAQYLMCASPERFIQKVNNALISQPIKGTINRDVENAVNDLKLKKTLESSEKNQTENVMIVDLVRNDMSRISEKGSVHVPELFKVDSHPQVYQMKSTIGCSISRKLKFTEIIEAMFPMGSMTGAPKKKVLELTKQLEVHPRGLYSGTVGYIDPQKNFDFNVVIRSILYYDDKKYMEYYVGGGITCNSNPGEEYEECLLKAKAISKVLGISAD